MVFLFLFARPEQWIERTTDEFYKRSRSFCNMLFFRFDRCRWTPSVSFWVAYVLNVFAEFYCFSTKKLVVSSGLCFVISSLELMRFFFNLMSPLVPPLPCLWWVLLGPKRTWNKFWRRCPTIWKVKNRKWVYYHQNVNYFSWSILLS